MITSLAHRILPSAASSSSASSAASSQRQAVKPFSPPQAVVVPFSPPQAVVVPLTRTKPKLPFENPVRAREIVVDPPKRMVRLVSCADLTRRSEEDLAHRIASRLFLLDSAEALPSATASEHFATRFNSQRTVSISVEAYLLRIINSLTKVARDEQARDDPNCPSDLAVRYLVASHILIERIRKTTGLSFTHTNAHRLIITGVLLACKLLDDDVPSNDFYAKVGGVVLEELASLEVAFLQLLHWDCSINATVFCRTYDSVIEDY